MPAAEASQRSAALTGALRAQSPGRAHCQMNYPLGIKVVQVDVLDRVKAARAEVLTKYSKDILGLRGPSWNADVTTCTSKYTRAASDEQLANQLAVGAIHARDTRTASTSLCTATFNTQRYHAFDRGEVTTGWNFSTVLPRRYGSDVSHPMQQMDTSAHRNTLRQTQTLTRYQSPVQREQAFADAQRAAKEAEVARQRALVQQYGEEGAAVMQRVLAMKQQERKPRIKTTKDDLAAVAALPDLDPAPEE